MVRTKVFVGNLDFKTKETELAKAFSSAGKVISANIITRGSRSLGYGFVEMENEEDAKKAVTLMNKKEIDGRPVNVEVAKPREETAPAAPGQPQQQQQQQAQPADQQGQQGSFQKVGSRGGRGRGGRGRGRGRGGYRGRGGFRRGGKRGGRGGATGGAEASTENNNQQQPKSPQPQQQQPKQQQPDNRTPSKVTLFVANLPFKLDDEGFSKSLKDHNVAFKSAYVVKNQRSGRSKGFGFIEFENEGDQQKALASLDKKVVDGRELVVKVALTEAQPKGEQQQNGSAPTKQ